MNKDIQALIEREAEEIASKSLYPDKITNITVYSKACINNYFKAGANFAISLFKWRKVEEEMPDERTDINIKSHGCIYSSRMVRIDDVPIFFISGVSLTVKLEDITEWMPIPQID